MKRFLLYNIIILLVLVFLQHLLYASVGPNANEMSFSNKFLYNSFMPEGWGFFTKNARDKQYIMYKLRYGRLYLVTEKNTSFSSLGGLSRYSRRTNLEFRRLINNIPDTAWVKQEGNMNNIKYDITGYSLHLSNFKKGDILYIKPGDYLVVAYDQIPWAWSKYPDNFTPEYKILKIHLQ